MDTTRVFKITIGGREYDAAPLPTEHMILLNTLQGTGEGMLRSIRVLVRIVEQALGPAAYNDLTDRWLSGEIEFKDIGEAAPELLKLTVAAEKQAASTPPSTPGV
jgi:hypothetical protein